MLPPHLQAFATPHLVLDKGFVRLVDVLGDDVAVVTAARVSTGKGRSVHQWKESSRSEETDAGAPYIAVHYTCSVCGAKDHFVAGDSLPPEFYEEPCKEGDRRLIRYMLSNQHSTPFEFAQIVLHVKMPIYVARQWIRHRAASTSEYSARYSPMIDDMHGFGEGEWRAQGGTNRQGSAGIVTEWPEGFMADGGLLFKDHGTHMDMVRDMGPEVTSPGQALSKRQGELQKLAREVYEERLLAGVAREIARNDMPLSNYTEWYWTCDLRNLLHFLSLRLDPHAQQEIRVYAERIWTIVQAWMPLTAEAFRDYQLEAKRLSKQQVEAVRDAVASLPPTARDEFEAALIRAGLSTRENSELLTTVGLRG